MPNYFVVANGNRIEDLEVAGCDAPIGYKIYTGPAGEETTNEAYCGTRLVEYKFADFTDLAKEKKPEVDCGNGWECWQLTAEVSDEADVANCIVERE